MKFLPNRLLACVCLALSMSLVGGYVALSKPLVAAIPVFLLAWLRFGIGGAAMLHWLRRPSGEAPLTPRIRKLVFFESLFGNFLFSIFMLYGMSMTSALSAGVIMASTPAVVAVMSWAFLGERVAPRVWGAVGCAALGVCMLAFGQPVRPLLEGEMRSWDRLPWMGNALIFGAVLCEAAYAVIGKKLTGVLGARRIASLINAWGFALMTPLGLYAAMDFDFAAVQPGTWGLLLFYSLAASVWTVWLWMTGLKQVTAAQAGVFTVMLPISAALTGVFVLGEGISTLQFVAFAIAIAGVLLAALPGAVDPSRDGIGNTDPEKRH